MTAILAIKTDSGIYMGGDLMASTPQTSTYIKDSKVFLKDDMLFGMCGSVRFMDIVQYCWNPPERPISCANDKAYIVGFVVPSILEELKRSGLDSNVKGGMLIAYNGEFYDVDSGFGTVLVDDNVVSQGNGYEVVKAHADALLCHTEMEPEEIILGALEYASQHVIGVGGVGPVFCLREVEDD